MKINNSNFEKLHIVWNKIYELKENNPDRTLELTDELYQDLFVAITSVTEDTLKFSEEVDKKVEYYEKCIVNLKVLWFDLNEELKECKQLWEI
jgi:hypothetical protein